MKKILSILLTLALCVGLIPAMAVPVHAATANGTIDGTEISWSLSDSGVLTISGAGAIPNYGNENSLTTAPWKDYADDILSVVIENGIAAIGNNAFYGLPHLAAVSSQGNITSIGANAFFNCSALNAVNLVGTITSLGNYAFSKSGLTAFPNINFIGDLPQGCFRYCEQLKTAHIPEGITSVGYLTFEYCTALEEVTLPTTCTYFASSSFTYCFSLKSMEVKGVIESYGSGPFYGQPNDFTLSFTVKNASSIGSANRIGLNDDRNRITIYGIPGIYNISPNGSPRDTYNSASGHYYLFKSARNVISFDANGGSGNMDVWDHTFVGYKDDDTPSDALPANAFTCDGGTFAGWSTIKDIPLEDIKQFSYGMYGIPMLRDKAQAYCFVPHNGSVTLYAQWLPEEYYDIYISGVQVNSINKNDVLGDGTVRYDSVNKVLTLDGYDSGKDPGQSKVNDVYSNFVQYATIYSEIDGVQIKVLSDSTVTGNGNNYRDSAITVLCSNPVITVSEGATFTVKGSTDGSSTRSYASIYMNQGLTVNGPGTLIVNGPITDTSNGNAVYDDLVVNGDANVILTSGCNSAGAPIGTAVASTLTVNSGSVVATGNPAIGYQIIAADGLIIYAGSDASNVTVFTGTHRSEYEPYVKVTAPRVFDISITSGTGMALHSGSASQSIAEGDAITNTVYTASEGYYFPADYSVAAVNGISVTRDSLSQITVSGIPTADATIVLAGATEKQKPAVPSVEKTDCTTADNNDGSITGVNETMEYQKAGDTTWTSITGTILPGLVPGTYSVRVKETDTAFASDAATVMIAAYNAPPKVDAPVFTPASGASFTESLDVTISIPNNAKVYYTTDQSEPSTTNGTLTTGAAIILTETTTLKAVAVSTVDGFADSDIATATYTKTTPSSGGGGTKPVEPEPAEPEPVDPEPAEPDDFPFVDVPEDAYYRKPVEWAVEKGITSGVSKDEYGPELSCTRAQVVTFLWITCGSPDAGTSTGFNDVDVDAYYDQAVAWAVEQGITAGTSEGEFGPDMTITRAQFVTMLWVANGKPEVDGEMPFKDVPGDSYYAKAVAWAYANDITAGKSADSFGPEDPCTRGQIMTLLYNAYGE